MKKHTCFKKMDMGNDKFFSNVFSSQIIVSEQEEIESKEEKNKLTKKQILYIVVAVIMWIRLILNLINYLS